MGKYTLAALDQKYSITFVGIIIIVLSQILQRLNITVATEALSTTIETLLLLGGALLALWGRWRKGDVNIFGFKK